MRWLAGDARAFVAAVRKELRQIRRYPMLVVGSLFWPILLPSVYVLLGRVYSGGSAQAMSAFASRTGTTDVAGFVFVGFFIYMWLSLFLWGPGTQLRQEQLRGTLESLLLTPASRLVILFGPPVATAWPVLVQGVVMVVGLRVLFGVELPPDALGRAGVVAVVGIPAMYALSSLFAALVLKFGEIGPTVQFVRGILVLLAGITYPLAMLPDWARATASAMPTTYVVSDVRAALLAGAPLSSMVGDLALLVGLTALMAVLAVAVYSWIERDARRTGALSRY